MNEENTSFPSLRNIEWGTIKIKTEIVNQLLTNIPTKNITESDKLIYAGAKLVFEKMGGSLKEGEQKSNPGWEIWLETQIRKQTKMVKQRKNAGEWNWELEEKV